MYGRLAKTKRAIHSTYASVLVGLAECLPLGVLQVTANSSFSPFGDRLERRCADEACNKQSDMRCKFKCMELS